MSSPIDKKELEHLAELARIKLDPGQEEKLLKDLQKILDHFEELKEVDTKEVAPMTGGTNVKNRTREDVAVPEDETRVEKLRKAFPNESKGYLKVPAVFE